MAPAASVAGAGCILESSRMDLSTDLQRLVTGLAMGSIYGLVALGFVLTFNAVNVVTLKKRRNR